MDTVELRERSRKVVFMSRDYDEIVSIVRKQTFAMRACFVRAESLAMSQQRDPKTKKEKDESPLNIYGSGTLSRFPVVVINESRQAATANIPVDDAPYIFRRSEFALNKAMEMELIPAGSGRREEKSKAYTVRLKSNRYQEINGKTPAQAYAQGYKEELNAHYKWLKDNLSKYPKNKEQMEAITETGRLAKAGNLNAEDAESAVATSFVLYDTGMKPLMRKADPKYPGMNAVYELKVEWEFGQKYPVRIKIENYFAPVITKESGMLNVEKSKRAADSVAISEIRLSADEWEHVIYRMKMSMRNFEILNAKACADDSAEQIRLARQGNLRVVANL